MNRFKKYQKYIFALLIILSFTFYLGVSLINGEVEKPKNPYQNKNEQVSKVALDKNIQKNIYKKLEEKENKNEVVESESKETNNQKSEIEDSESKKLTKQDEAESKESRKIKPKSEESASEKGSDFESESEEVTEPESEELSELETETETETEPESKEALEPESEPESESEEPSEPESETEPEPEESPESESEREPEPEPEESKPDPEPEPTPDPGVNLVGNVSISIEADKLGLGVFASNSNMGIMEGDNGVDLLNRFFSENGIGYKNTGNRDSSFYLVSINIPGINQGVNIPEDVLAKLEEEQVDLDLEVRDINSLGEFDYTNESGWMYFVNGNYMNYGFSDYIAEDGDDIRIRFTLRYGRDMD